MKRWAIRAGLLILPLGVFSALVYLSVPFFKAMTDNACGLPAAATAVSKGDALNCTEFWLNRYQTFFAALIGFFTAIGTVAVMWSQTSELRRQVSVELIPHLQARRSKLDEIRRAFSDANGMPDNLFGLIYHKTKFSDFQVHSPDEAFINSELRKIHVSLNEAVVLAKTLSEVERKVIVAASIKSQSEIRWLTLDWSQFYNSLSKMDDMGSVEEAYDGLRAKTMEVLERHNTATQEAVRNLKQLIKSATERLDQHGRRIIE